MPPHIAATLIGSEITPPCSTDGRVRHPGGEPAGRGVEIRRPDRFTIQRTGNRIREVDTLTGEVVADFTIETPPPAGARQRVGGGQ